ncbi:MAG: 4-hydroxy-3-methylbut-2-enyl diphosphate reductase [Clostridia bacterium]|nr:4-hydroxy-3-methylbut-2-enyl diphosphate reductase [Clostridia bacterium]
MIDEKIEVAVAKYAGFCYGVKNAVDSTRNALEENDNVYSTDHIVHNQVINEEFEKNGMHFVDSIEDIPEGATIILRAHGVGKSTINECENKNLKIINTTCPNVLKIHEIVKKHSAEGYKIIIVGDKHHDEINGIIGWIDGEYEVVSTLEEVGQYKKICLVSQTTTNIDFWNEISEKIKSNAEECIVFNTICMATYNRQKEAKELAQEVDTFIVVGDLKSANSKRLYEISKEFCENTLFIQTESELELEMIRGKKVGITAGASTPDVVINKIIEKIKLGC